MDHKLGLYVSGLGDGCVHIWVRVYWAPTHPLLSDTTSDRECVGRDTRREGVYPGGLGTLSTGDTVPRDGGTSTLGSPSLCVG